MIIMQVRPDSSYRSQLWSHFMTPIVPWCPMVATRSCDGTHSNMWIPILPSIKRMALTTSSMKGLGTTIEVLYLGYRGMPVTAQPHNPAWDSPGLPGASSTWYQDSQHSNKYISSGASHLWKGITDHYDDRIRQRLVGPTPRTLAAK
jgi:hypothetical protein